MSFCSGLVKHRWVELVYGEPLRNVSPRRTFLVPVDWIGVFPGPTRTSNSYVLFFSVWIAKEVWNW